MVFIAFCPCGWSKKRDTKQEAEISAVIHEETNKLRPYAHDTVVHREDE